MVALTLAMLAPLLHDVVPHDGLHDALAAPHAATTCEVQVRIDGAVQFISKPLEFCAVSASTQTATPTRTSTGTPMPEASATATRTAPPTQTMTPPPTITQTATQTITPSSTATGTPPPPTAGHPCNASDDGWHPAVIGSCQAGHEHGDQPPSWIGAAGYQVRFTGPFNTSLNENGQAPDAANPTRLGKHNGMKGYGFRTTSGVDYYVRYHAATNVHDRMARFHSYEVWARDPSGNVSHVVGWINTGDPQKFGNGAAGAGGRRNGCSFDPDVRPEVVVVTSMTDFNTCSAGEQWYFYPIMFWGPTFSINVHATTIAYAGENTETSMTFWRPTGALGILRAGGLAWNPRGDSTDPRHTPPLDQPFWATQFGELVSGPSHPRCSGTTTFPPNATNIHPFPQAETHQNVCLQQYVASTLPFINEAGPGKDYSAPGLRLPN